jgi:hypothetical protein
MGQPRQGFGSHLSPALAYSKASHRYLWEFRGLSVFCPRTGTKTTHFRPQSFRELIKNWTLSPREICLTHHHAPSILIAIGSPEPQEGFFMADEVMTKHQAAEG